MRHVIELSVRARFEEHEVEFTVLSWAPNSPDLNQIENIRVVRFMDSQQLTTHLESAWLRLTASFTLPSILYNYLP